MKVFPLKTVAFLFLISLLPYFYFMFVKAFVAGGWKELMDTLRVWQSLNTGMLAFSASLIAFYISGTTAEKERTRQIIAAKALLPFALVKLDDYLKESAKTYDLIYQRACQGEEKYDSEPIRIPALPEKSCEVLANCISVERVNLGQGLSDLLSDLQVHHSRMDTQRCARIIDISPEYAIYPYLCCLAKLQILVNRGFVYARGAKDLNAVNIKEDELFGAFSNLNIFIDKFEGFSTYALKFCRKMQ